MRATYDASDWCHQPGDIDHCPVHGPDAPTRRDLANILHLIHDQDPSAGNVDGLDQDEIDQMYARRNNLIWQAAGLASRLGYPVGIAAGEDSCGAQPDWPVLYIELPTGQCSWHVPAWSGRWDEHSTAVKYLRTAAYVDAHGGDVAELVDEAFADRPTPPYRAPSGSRPGLPWQCPDCGATWSGTPTGHRCTEEAGGAS